MQWGSTNHAAKYPPVMKKVLFLSVLIVLLKNEGPPVPASPSPLAIGALAQANTLGFKCGEVLPAHSMMGGGGGGRAAIHCTWVTQFSERFIVLGGL